MTPQAWELFSYDPSLVGSAMLVVLPAGMMATSTQLQGSPNRLLAS